MGFFGFGDKKQKQQQVQPQQQQQAQPQQQPQQELTFPQKVYRIWHSNQNYVTKGGYEYDWQHKRQIDESMYTNLGCSNLDDLLEIKAPNFYDSFYTICEWIVNMGRNVKFIKKNIQSNNDYQTLLGKYEELQKRCEQQENLIRDLTNCRKENKQLSPLPQRIMDLYDKKAPPIGGALLYFFVLYSSSSSSLGDCDIGCVCKTGYDSPFFQQRSSRLVSSPDGHTHPAWLSHNKGFLQEAFGSFCLCARYNMGFCRQNSS